MLESRVNVVQDNLRRSLEDAVPHSPRRDPDQPLRNGSSLSCRAAIALFQDQVMSRLLDVMSRELKDRNEGLQRARKKVAQASNIREANAAEREVEANRRAIKEREDELGRIAHAIEAMTASLAERESDFDATKSSLQADEESSRARIAELEEQRAKLLDGRDVLAAKVSKTIIKRYQRLKTGIPNAVIIISDGTCTACRMALPPQLTIELQRANELHQCPHCRRIIIHKAVIED